MVHGFTNQALQRQILCGGPGFFPFEIHVFVHNVLSFKVMFFGSLVKNNKLRDFAVSFQAVESEITEKMVKSYFSI